MTSQKDFATQAGPFLDKMVERLTNEHAAQYYHEDTGLQDFETCEISRLIDWAEDEAIDLSTYGLMYYTRLQRLRKVTGYIQDRLHSTLVLITNQAAILKQTTDHAWQAEPELKHQHPDTVRFPNGTPVAEIVPLQGRAPVHVTNSADLAQAMRDHAEQVTERAGSRNPGAPLGHKSACGECGRMLYERTRGDRGRCLHCGHEGPWT